MADFPGSTWKAIKFLCDMWFCKRIRVYKRDWQRFLEWAEIEKAFAYKNNTDKALCRKMTCGLSKILLLEGRFK